MKCWLLAVALFVPVVLLGSGCSKSSQDGNGPNTAPADQPVTPSDVGINKPKKDTGSANTTDSLNRDETLDEVARLAAAGEFRSALPLLQRMLLVEPGDVAVLFPGGAHARGMRRTA